MKKDNINEESVDFDFFVKFVTLYSILFKKNESFTSVFANFIVRKRNRKNWVR